MPAASDTLAAAVHSKWAARGRMPSVVEVAEALGDAYGDGRKAGAVELSNRLRAVMKTNYAADRRTLRYCDAVEQMVAVMNNELADMVGTRVES